MKVLILGAGYATRLYPLTATRPKPLLTVADRPMLEWILEGLSAVEGIDRGYLVTNERFARQYAAWLRDAKTPWPVELINDGSTSDQDKLGAVGDLQLAIEKKSIRDDLLVMAGDNLLRMDMGAFAREFARRHETLVALKDVTGSPMIRRYSVVTLDADRRIIDFEEKPAYPQSSLIAICLYLLPGAELPLVERYLSEGHNRDAPGYYIQWLHRVTRVYGHVFKDLWFDIGDIDSYNEANRVYQGLTR
ncbi:MAG: nucleotidyltransferase family protein [Planctomycetes bacterium]|nr:nucleotidyltransferase family protein [Planctomycetota bacterium]